MLLAISDLVNIRGSILFLKPRLPDGSILLEKVSVSDIREDKSLLPPSALLIVLVY